VFESQAIVASTTDRAERAPLRHARRGAQQAPTRHRATGRAACRLAGAPERMVAEER
jgi:hypothetical protein